MSSEEVISVDPFIVDFSEAEELGFWNLLLSDPVIKVSVWHWWVGSWGYIITFFLLFAVVLLFTFVLLFAFVLLFTFVLFFSIVLLVAILFFTIIAIEVNGFIETSEFFSVKLAVEVGIVI